MHRFALFLWGAMGLTALGCATQRSSGRWLVEVEPRELAPSRDERIVELEARLAAVERMRAVDAVRTSAELQAVLGRIDALLVQNRELMSRRAEPSVEVACSEAVPGGDAEAQLRYWAARLRANTSVFRGGLSPAQSAALEVLVRPERELDRDNPWHDL